MMNAREGGNEPQPIIIVRRRRMDEDGHHGGAWKIAFADFMTAMMALFLVLWLVNASDTDARKALASYFNPVKLVDRDRSRRGLSEPGASEPSPNSEKREPTDADGALSGEGREAERAFRAAPEAVMAAREALAVDAATTDVERPAAVRSEDAPSLASELRPRDPFAVEVAGPDGAGGAEAAEPSSSASEVRSEAAKEDEEATAETAALQAELREAVGRAFADGPAVAETLRAVDRGDGVVVELSDGPSRPMFDSGSFVPKGATVAALRAVAAVLAKREGGIRIEGHTDSRPVRGPGDNWRLSTERAHAARLMLLRGGLAAERIVAVSGHAASRPLAGLEPEAGGNRRIEIVLERR